MSWFQPGSLEPLHKFELLGLLVSLAVYNGLTLPFSFPTALYRNLLGLPVTSLADIEDGWPELARGLRTLRDWPDDNVEEVFARTFVFSVDVFGTTVDVEMNKGHEGLKGSLKQWQRRNPLQTVNEDFGKREALSAHPPTAAEASTSYRKPRDSIDDRTLSSESENRSTSSSDRGSSSSSESDSSRENDHCRLIGTPAALAEAEYPPSEPKLVTNANRHQYIEQYIAHLTHYSIHPQLAAFKRGFFTCISSKSITLFSPTQLKHLIEGIPDISVLSLHKIARYEGGYHEHHPTIMLFWGIVRSWPQERVRKLLEFVTASDRLPAGGMERVTFVIQKNGTGEGRWLPTSLTCFGRLLLPEYKSESLMREALETAVENSKGFGQP